MGYGPCRSAPFFVAVFGVTDSLPPLFCLFTLKMSHCVSGSVGLVGPCFKPRSSRRFPELLIERRQNNLLTDRILPCQGRRELDGVVAAQAVLPRQRSARSTSASVIGTRTRSGQSPANLRWAFRATSTWVTRPVRAALASAAATSARADDRRGGHLGFSRERDRFSVSRARRDNASRALASRYAITRGFSTTRSATVFCREPCLGRASPPGGRRPLHAIAPAFRRASTRSCTETPSGMMRATGWP